jgi:amino acid transporter
LTVFWWLVDLTAAGVLVSWSVILLNHIRLKLAMKRQGFPNESLPWHNSWTCKSLPRFLVVLMLMRPQCIVLTLGCSCVNLFC